MVGHDAGNIGTFLHDAIDAIAHRVEHPKAADYFTTGMEHLDASGVNVERGEIGCVLARAKGGKSFALLNIAFHNLIHGRNVVYYNLEIQEDRLEDRFGRRITMPKEEHKVNPQAYVARLRKRFPKLVKGKLLLKRFFANQTSIDDIRANLLQCHAQGFKPDLVIVDYAGLLKPAKVYDEMRFNLASLWLDFRGLCQEFNVAGWSAAQANRGGAAADLVTMTDIAESFAIVQHIDVGFSISRTPEEIEKNTGRFFVFASRNDKDGTIVNFEADFGRSLIKTTGLYDGASEPAKKGKDSTDQQSEEASFRDAQARMKKEKKEHHGDERQ